jgi:hypothetical protein
MLTITLKTGGKHYSRNLKPLDENGNEISMWSEDAQKQFQNSSQEESDEDESSDDGTGLSAAQGAKSREDRKKEKKARKEAAVAKRSGQAIEVGDMPSSDEDSEEDSDDDMPVNPNHTKAARNQAKAPQPTKDVDEAAEGVKEMSVEANRKERESSEAAAAKARYQKLHEQGKTDEAKADLARLKVIKEQRAAEAARRAVLYPPVYPRTLEVSERC